MMFKKEERLYGVGDLADYLGLNHAYVHELIRKKKVKEPKVSIQYGRGRVLRQWSQKEMEAIKKSREK